MYAGGTDIGFHARGCAFTADVVHIRDSGSAARVEERKYGIGVYKFPSHELLAGFKQQVTGAGALAATRKHLVKSSAVRLARVGNQRGA